MDRFAPRPYRRTVAEHAVRALLVEVPAWTLGLALVLAGRGVADQVLGGLVVVLAVGALIGSTFAVNRWSAWDQVAGSERRRDRFRRDPEAARAAVADRDAPDALAAREDAEAVLAEGIARKAASSLSDADLHASLRAGVWADEAAARAVGEGRWGDVLARSIELRVADDAEWVVWCARLDEAWFRAQARGG